MTQNEMLARYLKRGDTITSIEALRQFGIFRLAARICDLRESGMKITTQRVEVRGKRFARYQLRLG